MSKVYGLGYQKPVKGVYYHKGGKYVVSDYYSEAVRRRMEGILNGSS